MKRATTSKRTTRTIKVPGWVYANVHQVQLELLRRGVGALPGRLRRYARGRRLSAGLMCELAVRELLVQLSKPWR